MNTWLENTDLIQAKKSFKSKAVTFLQFLPHNKVTRRNAVFSIHNFYFSTQISNAKRVTMQCLKYWENIVKLMKCTSSYSIVKMKNHNILTSLTSSSFTLTFHH